VINRTTALSHILFMLMVCSMAWAVPFDIAVDGRAAHPIIVRSSASQQVKEATENLARQLKRISGARFEVRHAADGKGIFIGTIAEYPKAFDGITVDLADPLQLEQYVLKSHENGLFVVGASPIAVEHAVWDLLYQLGYRQFFPGPTWEVIPNEPSLQITIDKHEQPDYHTRSIWYGYGTWKFNKPAYEDWRAKNRSNTLFKLSTGHAYHGVMRRQQEIFDDHPEYMGLWNGKRGSTKFCVANRELRELYETDALQRLQANRAIDSISVDPTDGGNWCQCSNCSAVKSISDRAVILANHVADGVEQEIPGKYIGMYAYNEHAPPPNIRPHPKVVISTATAFLRGRSIDSVISGWKEAGVTRFGIREYYDVNTWSRNLPGKARGANTAYLARTIKNFHSDGARFMSAESGECFGPNGLGYYLATRMLWDVGESARIEQLKQDFYDRCFGSASDTMKEFYELIDGANRPTMSDDLVGRMYRLLDQAKRQTSNESERARINDLILYTRYVEMYRVYVRARDDQRQIDFESMLTHIYRMSRRMMVHSYAMFRDIDARDKNVVLTKEEKFHSPEDVNPLKSTDPFTEDELARMVSEGIAANPLLKFTPVHFSRDLIVPSPNAARRVQRKMNDIKGRGKRTYYTWFDKPNGEVKLKVAGGLISHYRDRGDVQITMYAHENPELLKPVATGATAPDGVTRQITLKSAFPGLHRIEISDGHDLTSVWWKPGTRMAIDSSEDRPMEFNGRWTLYVYVPKGTRIIGGYATISDGFLTSPDFSAVYKFKGKRDYFEIEVPRGQDGRLWEFRNCSGNVRLLTIPSLLFRDHKEVLLPGELFNAGQTN